MAVSYNSAARACDEDSDEEWLGINERILELLLKSPKSSGAIDFHTSRSLPITMSDNDPKTQLPAAGMSSSYMRHHCEYSYIRHESPTVPKRRQSFLPPIGVFWDIENCQVPKGRSAIAVTQTIRDKFFDGYKEAEFIVVCDVQKENKQIVQELNDAQVNLIHVAATCKNAADEKLRQSIRRFADIHGSPAAVILISGDINFAADLSDLRHRKKIHVILLHKENTSEALILCANEHYDFTQLTESLPSRAPLKVTESYDLLVCNLPEDKDTLGIKRRLKQLSNNCGGRVIEIQSKAAIVRFFSKESADRAQKRMHGEYVFNSKIAVQYIEDKENSNEENQGILIRKHTSSESEVVIESPRQMFASNTSAGARSLPVTPLYNPISPIVEAHSNWNGMHCVPSGIIQPTATFGRRLYPNNDVAFNRSYQDHSKIITPMVDKPRNVNKRIYAPQVRDNEMCESFEPRVPELRRVRGAYVNFNQQPEWNHPRHFWQGPPVQYGNGFQQNFMRRSPSPMYVSQQVHEPHYWNGGQNQHSANQGRSSSRTPSPYDFSHQRQHPHRSSPFNEAGSDEVENFFNPINNRNGESGNDSFTPIELQISNLDQNINIKDMKRILSSLFMEHVMVLHVSVFEQSDGNHSANIKVPSLQEAQYAISQLHRRKIGYKRILISYAHASGPNPQVVRSHIVMLLQEVPGHKLPLFKFREMYESRFMISISISEIYKLKDVCVITEDPGGRMVALHPDHRNTPSPNFGNASQIGQALDLPYCTIHTQKPWSSKGWAEQEMASLPNVKISLKMLGNRIHQLLISHNGHLPLASLPNCYDAEFKEPLNVDENGVPLEHLVSCLSTIELKQGLGCVKYLIWSEDKSLSDSHEENKCVSPPLASQLALFSREIVDLLKTVPHCQLSFNRFIPAYHHHFGRQCRVADYGFTKLIDLLESLSQTVQVMGEGNKRVVTLSHRAQLRRFTSDLLRILKAQASKQVMLSEFPNVYSRVIGKSWDVVDYGVCNFEDLLNEVPENIVVVTHLDNGDKIIAIPKREQTPEEIIRTKQFAVEVVELLRHAPQNQMLFNKFVPSYHHHFGHQCRVSDYGFTKLIELFESIPEFVKIEDASDGERRISLTEKEGLRVLGEQMMKLISRSKGSLSISNIAHQFLQQFGYAIRPELFGYNSILQLMQNLSSHVKVVRTGSGEIIVPANNSHLHQLGLQCRRVLMDQPQHRLKVDDFQKLYAQFYNKKCDFEEIKKKLTNIVKFATKKGETFIELTPLQRFACNLHQVLMNYGGSVNLLQFESAYFTVTGSLCKATELGFPTVAALLQSLPCTVVFKEARSKKKVYLNKKLASVGIPLPFDFSFGNQREVDSSNESAESDTSSTRLNQSNVSTIEEKRSWPGNSKSVWGLDQEDSDWNKKGESHWVMCKTQNWPDLDCSENSFLKGLTRQKNFPPPPNSVDTSRDNENDSWLSSVWSTPPKYLYSNDEHSTNVEVPPLTVQWNQISESDACNLLSPTKNLLPAVANPLNARISPFFATGLDNVIAPHPSELPLPSISLTPKKCDPNDAANAMANSLFNEKESDSVNRANSPSKRTTGSKRRLAAQFNQPVDS